MEDIVDDPEDPANEEDPYNVDSQAHKIDPFQFDEHLRNMCFQKIIKTHARMRALTMVLMLVLTQWNQCSHWVMQNPSLHLSPRQLLLWPLLGRRLLPSERLVWLSSGEGVASGFELYHI